MLEYEALSWWYKAVGFKGGVTHCAMRKVITKIGRSVPNHKCCLLTTLPLSLGSCLTQADAGFLTAAAQNSAGATHTAITRHRDGTRRLQHCVSSTAQQHLTHATSGITSSTIRTSGRRRVGVPDTARGGGGGRRGLPPALPWQPLCPPNHVQGREDVPTCSAGTSLQGKTERRRHLTKFPKPLTAGSPTPSPGTASGILGRP